MAHAGGRPKKYNTVEEVNKVIQEYFDSCFEPLFIKSTGEPFINDKGEILTHQVRPFTIGGLADALDMTRQSLLNYSKDEKFFDTIMRAKRKCEVYAEERLFDKDGVNGAKFTLINNYDNWKEKTEVNSNVKFDKSPINELIESIDNIKNENQ